MSGSGRDEPRIDGERYIEKFITTPFINWIMDSADTDYADCSCPDGCQKFVRSTERCRNPDLCSGGPCSTDVLGRETSLSGDGIES